MLIHMGERQSTEEKFAEIAKMDKTQFVVYAARLFGYRGYRVKFTPVIDNYDVDLLVEKMGVTICAVMLTDRISPSSLTKKWPMSCATIRTWIMS